MELIYQNVGHYVSTFVLDPSCMPGSGLLAKLHKGLLIEVLYDVLLCKQLTYAANIFFLPRPLSAGWDMANRWHLDR